MSVITINGNSPEPATQQTMLQAYGIQKDHAADSNYILIQTLHPLSKVQKDQLSSWGVEIHEYVSENTYLCCYQTADINAIRRINGVTWANVYPQLFVLPPRLKEPVRTSEPAVPSLASAPQTNTLKNVDIVFHDGVEATDSENKSAVATAAHVPFDILKPSGNKIRIQVQEQYLDEIAALDKVKVIHEVHPTKLFNDRARTILHANINHLGANYQGHGEVIAVTDTGYNRGSLDPQLTLPTFAPNKIRQMYALGRPSAIGTGHTDDPDGHGTHVCGSVVGGDMFNGANIESPTPQASLVVQSLIDDSNGLGGIPPNLTTLFNEPYENDKARIHTNSWGYSYNGTQLSYDPSSTEIDDFVWNHPEMVICFAAVIDLAQIGAHAAAKNCITVGASESDQGNPRTYHSAWPSRYPMPPIRNDPMADNANGMAAFSSRGPTKEGRIKPDVVAPGTSILSARSRASSLPASNIWGTSSGDWVFLGGTSMATPLVAGCVAVLLQTLRALLINGATELIGQYNPPETAQSPNGNSGYGLVNLANSVVFGMQPDRGYVEANPLGQGDEREVLKIPIPIGSKHLKVTLVWTDPPGPYLQNDIDLTVAVDGQERHGNMGSNPGYDRVNNVEQVSWVSSPAGEATVSWGFPELAQIFLH
ncbi:peptidase S8/S53 domain-containing protein [Aspergillus cavernicola]|uniref:Peptidase S8/S53 domain-containing protein n=1 Tax=Aspergillus cavernicola TaxID=176166 RepID=A0ABR4HAV2_9EURO